MTGVPRYKRIDVFAFQGPQDYRIAETHAPLNSGETFRGQTRPEGLIVIPFVTPLISARNFCVAS